MHTLEREKRITCRVKLLSLYWPMYRQVYKDPPAGSKYTVGANL